MNQLQKVFDYEKKPVRTVILDGEAWFVAKDVCEVLGIVKHRDAISRLDEDERGSVVVDTLGGRQSVSAVNEYGLYALIFNSRKKSAKQFKRWVTHDVLPEIRKNGKYEMQPSYMIENPVDRAKRWIEEQQQIQLLEQRAAQYEEKADYVDQILKSVNTVNTTQIAKDYGMSAVKLNRILKEEGIQYKVGGQWVLKAAYHDKGYTKSHTVDIIRTDGSPDVKMNTHWTQAGRLFIHKILQERGHVALIDKAVIV